MEPGNSQTKDFVSEVDRSNHNATTKDEGQQKSLLDVDSSNDDTRDMECGIGSFRPSCFQPCANIYCFFKSIIRILRQPPYILLASAMSVKMLGIAGVFSFNAKYLEVQFFLPAWKSNAVMVLSTLPFLSFHSHYFSLTFSFSLHSFSLSLSLSLSLHSLTLSLSLSLFLSLSSALSTVSFRSTFPLSLFIFILSFSLFSTHSLSSHSLSLSLSLLFVL
ncbi:unnamed protein product [Acanthosepion pharaonis]|uniref:Uncharacterized protein n=1 Tax=Acanthosepion pharaonis TaxID=158019 RepID=A0A812D6M5_ACAPH|nr:unnamed protein product [Sepia pharaonis]